MKIQLVHLFFGFVFLIAAHVSWIINPIIWLSALLTVCGIVNLFLCTVLGMTKGKDDDDEV